MRLRVIHKIPKYLMALTVAMSFVPVLAEVKIGEVNDLSYGVALFNFYQDRHFSAINELLVDKEVRPISRQESDNELLPENLKSAVDELLVEKDINPDARQKDDNELLLGSLYLAYGLHHDADRIFKELLDQKTSRHTSDRAWFNLAKLQYQRGVITAAAQSLEQIKDTLPDHREAERLNLLTNIYLQEKEYDKAIETVKEFAGDSAWEDYARFNLGVSLARQGRLEEGVDYLDSVGDIKPTTSELAALRDKANLALGFALMRSEKPAEASKAFSRVRLSGPLSNKALLGIGWSWNVQKEYKKALVPWMELQTRSPLDPAVQESLLAIPYTMEKIDKPKLALVNYNQANQNFDTQLQELERTITAIKDGELLRALRPANLGDETALSIYRSKLPASITVPYIYTLLASEQFQVAINNYQDLLYLKYVLVRWNRYLPVFNLMLKERRKAYQQKLPEVAGDARLKQVQRMQSERDQLAMEVARIEKENDVFALATAEEQETIEQLDSLKQRLGKLSKSQDLSEARDKYRLLHGIMYWQIGVDYVPRYWQAKKQLKELDAALNKAIAANSSLQTAWIKAPARFEGFNERIKGQQSRINKLQKRIDSVLLEQQNIIQMLALNEVYQQRDRLKSYQVRAKFAQARLYDSMAKAGDGK